MSIHEGPVTAPATRPYQEPDALPTVALDGVTLPPVWPHWITTIAEIFGVDVAIAAALIEVGREEERERAENVWRAAARTTEWVARDLRSGRRVHTRQDDIDREAAALFARVHPEMVTT